MAKTSKQNQPDLHAELQANRKQQRKLEGQGTDLDVKIGTVGQRQSDVKAKLEACALAALDGDAEAQRTRGRCQAQLRDFDLELDDLRSMKDPIDRENARLLQREKELDVAISHAEAVELSKQIHAQARKFDKAAQALAAEASEWTALERQWLDLCGRLKIPASRGGAAGRLNGAVHHALGFHINRTPPIAKYHRQSLAGMTEAAFKVPPLDEIGVPAGWQVTPETDAPDNSNLMVAV